MKRLAASGVSAVLFYAEKIVVWVAVIAGLHQDFPPFMRSIHEMAGTVTFELLRFALLIATLAAIWLVPWDRLKGRWPFSRNPSPRAFSDGASRKGILYDLDVAIRASGDTPERISEWPDIRHWLRKRFGDGFTDEELWERFRDWIRDEKGLHPNTWLLMTYDEAIKMVRK